MVKMIKAAVLEEYRAYIQAHDCAGLELPLDVDVERCCHGTCGISVYLGFVYSLSVLQTLMWRRNQGKGAGKGLDRCVCRVANLSRVPMFMFCI